MLDFYKKRKLENIFFIKFNNGPKTSNILNKGKQHNL